MSNKKEKSIMNKWNKTNALWVLLYAVLYVIMTYWHSSFRSRYSSI